MKSGDFGLPADWHHWASDPAEDRIGPFFHSRIGDGAQTGLAVAPHHCNT